MNIRFLRTDDRERLVKIQNIGHFCMNVKWSTLKEQLFHFNFYKAKSSTPLTDEKTCQECKNYITKYYECHYCKNILCFTCKRLSYLYSHAEDELHQIKHQLVLKEKVGIIECGLCGNLCMRESGSFGWGCKGSKTGFRGADKCPVYYCRECRPTFLLINRECPSHLSKLIITLTNTYRCSICHMYNPENNTERDIKYAIWTCSKSKCNIYICIWCLPVLEIRSPPICPIHNKSLRSISTPTIWYFCVLCKRIKYTALHWRCKIVGSDCGLRLCNNCYTLL